MEKHYSELFKINEYIQKYGKNASLKDIKRQLMKKTPYICPKCSGRGYITEEYNSYPANLPDSGFVYEAAWRDVKCDLCCGVGYTIEKMRPKLVQQGWEKEQ